MISKRTKNICIIAALACLAILGGTSSAQTASTAPATMPATNLPIIIIKADDVTAAGASGGRPVSARWQKFVDYIDSKNIKASFGIIGFSLEKDNQPYFDWIKEVNKKGNIEFWNHGYKYRVSMQDTPEFTGTSLEEQKKAIGRTQELAREKLGIEIKAFAPHFSGTDATTIEAVRSFPEIKVWFAYWDGPHNLTGTSLLVLKRTIELEYPTHVPNFEKLKKDFRIVGAKYPYMYLQGHPNQWDDKRFEDFTKIVDFLIEKGCTFMTVSEYYKFTTKATASSQPAN